MTDTNPAPPPPRAPSPPRMPTPPRMPAPPPPRRSARGTVLRLLLVLVALLLLAAGALAYYGYSLTRAPGGGEFTLEVTPGMSLGTVARTLEAEGIVRDERVLRQVMRYQGTAGGLKEGLYDLSGDMNAFEVSQALAGNPRIPVVEVTIPEGLRLRDLPPIFAAAELGDPQALPALLQDASLSRYARGTLEGFLFPARYPFRPNASNEDIVGALIARMEQEFTPERVAQAEELGLDVYEWVTLASMVQAEAGNLQEMPVIAGVFLNRIDEGMTLGSDPTVAYGLGKDLPELNRFEGDFQNDHPWNTYTRRGLPQTPINNPGADALQSVLNAERNLPDGRAALYFLHGLGREFRVNHTYAEHNADIARFRSR